MGNDKAILKQGLLRLHRGGVSVSGLKKRKRVEVTLCHPSSLADVQLLYERLFLDVSSGGGRDGLDRKTIQYLGELGFAAALDAPLLILRSPDGTGSPEFISLASLSVTDKDESLMDEESLCQACHWALRLPGSGDVIKFACQTSTDYLDWIRVVHGLWR